MASLDDIVQLDWTEAARRFPENFQPLDAIVIIRGVYINPETQDMTRPVWMWRFTQSLANDSATLVGVLQMLHKKAMEDWSEEFEVEG